MIWPLYYLSIYVMIIGIRISALWSQKSRLWISGRKNWLKKIKEIPPAAGPRIWIHVSSLGEFEQARPVIEKMKVSHLDPEIILTFFSPSGYMIRSDYPLATVLYLPADIPGNAEKWVDHIRPDLAVFVKYDLWPGYLQALSKQKIPAILFSAHWTPNHQWSSWNLPPARDLLKRFRMIFLQREDHLNFFSDKGYKRLAVAGDTRIDRSLHLPGEVEERLPSALKDLGPFDIVAGSTWPADEQLLMPVIEKYHLKVIIAPHDVSRNNIERLMRTLPYPAARLSELDELKAGQETWRIVVVDSIGVLNVLYALGRVAYIGGGLGRGIHNTLEAMAHSKPLIFGPRHEAFPEAVDMVKAGGAFAVRNEKELGDVVSQLLAPGRAERAGRTCHDYLLAHAGASDVVSKYIVESIPYAPES